MLERLQQSCLTQRLAKTLALLLLVQLMLPLQAHSRLVRSASGMTVLVCTLQGPRDMRLDLSGHHPGSTPPHASAAMAFSKLLNNISPLLRPLRPPRRVLAWNLKLPEAAEPAFISHRPAASSRDPPLV
jgi:hypothetical protein